MSCKTPNFHQNSFKIKHDDHKFIKKLLSKEGSKSDPSFRVYYGDVSSSVPFTWETTPGTPKHKSYNDDYVPHPLTPPPSYYTNNPMINNSSNKHSKLFILHNLLRRTINVPKKKVHLASSCSPSSSFSLSSWSASSDQSSSFSDHMMTTTRAYVHGRRRFSSFDGWDKIRLCWGYGKDNIERDGIKGGSSVLIVKKALLSVLGRGSA